MHNTDLIVDVINSFRESGIQISIDDFGRIAAQTAKQVIIQKIRDVEKDNLFIDFSSKSK